MGLDSDVNKLTVVSLFAAGAKTGNANSTTVDLKDYVGTVKLVIDAGAITDGDDDSTYTIKVQDNAADTATTYANVSTTYTVNALTNVASLQELDIPVRAMDRYFRLQGNIAGANSPSFPVSATLIGWKQVR